MITVALSGATDCKSFGIGLNNTATAAAAAMQCTLPTFLTVHNEAMLRNVTAARVNSDALLREMAAQREMLDFIAHDPFRYKNALLIFFVGFALGVATSYAIQQNDAAMRLARETAKVCARAHARARARSLRARARRW